MYTFITTRQGIQIRGILNSQSVCELSAIINEDFKTIAELEVDLSKLKELNLTTVMKLVQLQANYKSCGKQIVFKGLQNNSVRSSFGLAGKRELLRAVA